MEFLENWKEEKRSAYIYRILVDIEPNPVHQKLFMGLSKMAEKQAEIWEKQLNAASITFKKEYQPDIRTRILIGLVKRLGPKSMRLALAAMKVRGMSIYQASAASFVPSTPVEAETRHRAIKHSGNLRAGVFGMSDGLLSNASLMLGIAGATVSHQFILLSGIAGLLAGAFSMGAGEYVSVRSQRQMLEYQLELERQELEMYPEEETEELSLIYQARGLPKEEAEKIAKLLIQNPDQALNTLAREELGINPDELGSPWGAAFSSFFSFAIGAFIPIIPFLLSGSPWALTISIALTACSFFMVGAVLSLFTQRSAWWGGLRMLFIGAVAGSITYYIGSLLGVRLA